MAKRKQPMDGKYIMLRDQRIGWVWTQADREELGRSGQVLYKVMLWSKHRQINGQIWYWLAPDRFTVIEGGEDDPYLEEFREEVKEFVSWYEARLASYERIKSFRKQIKT